MYESHFGLRERPFSIAPDPSYLFLGAHHRDALAHLLYGVSERGGFIQLTGAVGTGKTTLTRALLQQLPQSVDVALLLNPSVSAQELLVAIGEELRIPLPLRTYSVMMLMTALRDYLLDAFGRGRHTVVLIDEAQNLSAEALEQVRLLTNLETNREKLLQIILVGQPELRDLLDRPNLRQVAQRVTARYHLTPLRYRETCAYIRHRLRTAGVERPLFSRAAMRIIHTQAGGIPRLINIISDRALLGAYGRNRQRISAAIAWRAAAEVHGRERRRLGRAALFAIALLGAVVFAGSALLEREQPLAEPVPVIAQPVEPPTLEDLLQHDDPLLDARVALGQLFALWGGHFQVDHEQTACEQAPLHGLRCRVDAISWPTLLQYNLPAVLELSAPSGARHAALLVGGDRSHAVIQLGETATELPLSRLLDAWTGNSVLLWRPPAEVMGTISPGRRGPAVLWLRQQLARIEGHAEPVTAADLYDAALRRRIEAFQRDSGLAIDGIVGNDTLFHLLQAAPEVGAPTLGRN